jgi:hypothetical protein
VKTDKSDRVKPDDVVQVYDHEHTRYGVIAIVKSVDRAVAHCYVAIPTALGTEAVPIYVDCSQLWKIGKAAVAWRMRPTQIQEPPGCD